MNVVSLRSLLSPLANVKGVAGFLAVFLVGGFVGYFVRDLPAFFSQEEDLPGQLAGGEYVGDEVLEITVVREDGTPMVGLEIDLWAEGKAEGPPTAAIGETNEEGVATFHLRPGTYLQGFNLSSWPEDLELPVGQREIVVQAGKTNAVSVTLKSR